MNDSSRGFVSADGRLLAAITLHTRAHPEWFEAGRVFLERSFTFAAIRARKEERLREELADAETGEATIFLSMLREKLEADFGPDAWEARHGHRYLPQRTMSEWIANRDAMQPLAHLGPGMSDEHAQAVLLIATFFWDRSPNPNPSLPGFMQKIPWGTPESTAATDFLAHRWTWMLSVDRSKVIESIECALERFLTGAGVDLRVLPSGSFAEPVREATSETPATKTGRPSEAKAYAGFRFACCQREDLSTETPGPEHHAYLRENHPEWLEGASKTNVDTWRALARRGRTHVEGRKRGTRKTVSRSIVRLQDID